MLSDKESRWSKNVSQELPKRKGTIKALSKFDAAFFGIHAKQACNMDPQGRTIVEVAYEAILDAGIHPQSLRDTKTGVFVGVCFSEADKGLFDNVNMSGFAMVG